MQNGEGYHENEPDHQPEVPIQADRDLSQEGPVLLFGAQALLGIRVMHGFNYVQLFILLVVGW